MAFQEWTLLPSRRGLAWDVDIGSSNGHPHGADGRAKQVGPMDYSQLPQLILDDLNMRILSATAFEALSVRDIAYMFNIPMVSCYRKINELESFGLLECVEKHLRANGKRVKKYKSQLIKVTLSLERGKLHISLDVSWKKNQSYEAQWSTIPEDAPALAGQLRPGPAAP